MLVRGSTEAMRDELGLGYGGVVVAMPLLMPDHRTCADPRPSRAAVASVGNRMVVLYLPGGSMVQRVVTREGVWYPVDVVAGGFARCHPWPWCRGKFALGASELSTKMSKCEKGGNGKRGEVRRSTSGIYRVHRARQVCSLNSRIQHRFLLPFASSSNPAWTGRGCFSFPVALPRWSWVSTWCS